MDSSIHQQIAQLQATIQRQEAAATRLDTEITALEQELEAFATRYQQIVGAAQAKLDAARAAVAELERRRYLETLADLPPEEAPRPLGFVPVAEQYRRVWIDPPPLMDEPEPTTRPLETPVPTDPETRLKQLYRALARRYHPDLAATPAERDYRTRLMVLINEAYENRDLDTLQILFEQPEQVSPDVPVAVLKLRQLQQTSAALAQRIEKMQLEQQYLLQSDWLRLKAEEKLAQRQGRDLLRERADKLEHEYWTVLALLQRLRQG
ncbi:MAG TPA: hypothetical protein VHO69_10225 [Phototrophicaceae bacterium]|nr:hypothetical protein [Phototrophicaceae bacterium]